MAFVNVNELGKFKSKFLISSYNPHWNTLIRALSSQSTLHASCMVVILDVFRENYIQKMSFRRVWPFVHLDTHPLTDGHSTRRSALVDIMADDHSVRWLEQLFTSRLADRVADQQLKWPSTMLCSRADCRVEWRMACCPTDVCREPQMSDTSVSASDVQKILHNW